MKLPLHRGFEPQSGDVGKKEIYYILQLSGPLIIKYHFAILPDMCETIDNTNDALYNLRANVRGNTFNANSATTSNFTGITNWSVQDESHELRVNRGFEQGLEWWSATRSG